MRVLVMGAGGIGGYYGGLLARAGHNVTFVARGHHLKALQNSGLTVESHQGASFSLAVDATDRPSGNPVDLLLLAVKTYDTTKALTLVRPMIGADTVVLTLQNGVGPGGDIERTLSLGLVAEGPAYVVSSITSPGVVRQTGEVNRVVIGAHNKASHTRVEALVQTLAAAGWPVVWTDQPQRDLWQKLSFLGPLAVVTTLTGLTAGVLRHHDSSAKLIDQLIHEYVDVGNAEGANLPPDAADTASRAIERYPAEGSTSMARDKEAGRRLETEALVGTTARRGAVHGIPTPATETAYRLLAPLTGGVPKHLNSE